MAEIGPVDPTTVRLRNDRMALFYAIDLGTTGDEWNGLLLNLDPRIQSCTLDTLVFQQTSDAATVITLDVDTQNQVASLQVNTSGVGGNVLVGYSEERHRYGQSASATLVGHAFSFPPEVLKACGELSQRDTLRVRIPPIDSNAAPTADGQVVMIVQVLRWLK